MNNNEKKYIILSLQVISFYSNRRMFQSDDKVGFQNLLPVLKIYNICNICKLYIFNTASEYWNAGKIAQVRSNARNVKMAPKKYKLENFCKE